MLYDKSLIYQVCWVKMAECWPRFCFFMHLDFVPTTRMQKKEKQLTAFFSENCSVSVFSFLLITISNQKKRTRVKEIYFDVMIMTDNCVNNHHHYNYKYLSLTWKSPEILANETAFLSLVRRLNHELHLFCS